MAQASENTTASAHSSELGPQFRVLVVDDNTTLLTVLTDTLKACGFAASGAETGELALEQLRHNQPDIILCDVQLPGINGYQLQEQVRSHAEWCNIPFVFLSALNDQEQIRYAKLVGCDEYVTKPFDPADLIATIQGKLALSRERNLLSKAKVDNYRKRIIHTLSHEFRTPLVAINTGAELLLDQHSQLSEERVCHLLKSVIRGGQRLQRLIDDFMILQQIDLGAAESNCHRMRRDNSLLSIAQTAIEHFAESGSDLHSEVELLVSPNEILAPCVASVFDVQIIDAVKRLLSNAQKFGGTNQPITVEVGQLSVDKNRRALGSITVRDRGPGLPSHVHLDALDLFTQIDRDRMEQQGCGLGLSIASYYIEINGGTISFHTPAGEKGLAAQLTFPLV